MQEQCHFELQEAWFSELHYGAQADFNMRFCMQHVVIPVLLNSVVLIFE